MRARKIFALSLSLAVVVLVSGSRAASAQGSPTIPTGGGSAREVTNLDDGRPLVWKFFERWFPLRAGARKYAAPGRAVPAWNRPSLAVVSRRHGR